MTKLNSIKKNFTINFVRVLLNMVFPLITFLYVCRIIHAEGVGKVSFVQGVINYFILVSSLGIPLYGIRAVAKVRDDKDKLSKLIKELLLIISISTLITFSIYMIIINFSMGKIYDNKELFLLFSLSLLFTNIGVEWFYQGVEEYEYIAKVSIAFKVISLMLLFILVKNENDYFKYGFVLIFSICGSNFFNFINLRKSINFKKKYELEIKKHLKPIFIIFGFNLAVSIYASLDTVMLGFLSTERAVGLYASSMRIVKAVVTLINSFGSVLIPRISYYIEKKQKREFERVAKLSLNCTLLLGLPSTVGLFILAPSVIALFGEEFLEAAVAMRIVVPLILIIGFSYFIGIQILYPHGQEKKVLVSAIVGAAMNFSLNLLLIPRYSYIGASIATLIAEIFVLIVQAYFGRKYLNFRIFNRNSYKYLLATILMGVTLCILPSPFENGGITVFLGIFTGGSIYFISLVLLKENLVYQIINKVIGNRVFLNRECIEYKGLLKKISLIGELSMKNNIKNNRKLSLSGVYNAFRKRSKIIICIIILSTAVTALVNFFVLKPVYQSNMSILIGRRIEGTNEGSYDIGELTYYLDAVDTYIVIAESEDVAVDASKRLKNKYAANELMAMVNVEVKPSTQILEFIIQTENKSDAKEIVEAICQSFKENAEELIPSGSVKILFNASVQDNPIKPNKLINIILAFILSLIASIGLVYSLYLLDNTVEIKDVSDKPIKIKENTEEITRLPIIGRIPKDANYEENKDILIAKDIPNESIVEAFKELQTNIQYSSIDKQIKTILITSSDSEEGKTWVICNLGVVIASLGKSVIIIDADMRKPTVHKKFKISNAKGLSEILTGQSKFKDVVHQEERLYVLTSGNTSPKPSEIIGSTRMKEFVENLKNYFDYILIDTPSLKTVADAQLISSEVDGVIIVTSNQADKVSKAGAAELLLSERANILGIVQNKVKTE